MNKLLAVILFFLTSILSPRLSLAEENGEAVPVGMEILKVGDARVLVPKGTQMRKQGDLNVVEDISEYSSRKFVEIEQRFGRLEEEIKGMKAAIEGLKERVKEK